jgi:hypothetical protein
MTLPGSSMTLPGSSMTLPGGQPHGSVAEL